MIALRVVHADLLGGQSDFSDDEVVELLAVPEQRVVTQVSQTGSRSFVYVGGEHFAFDILFNIYFQSTLQKLSAIRRLRTSFQLFPFIIEEPLTEYEVFWPEEPQMQERWVRGRRAAQWDMPVKWLETRPEFCIPLAGS